MVLARALELYQKTKPLPSWSRNNEQFNINVNCYGEKHRVKWSTRAGVEFAILIGVVKKELTG